jgi:hypothetical protein
VTAPVPEGSGAVLEVSLIHPTDVQVMSSRVIKHDARLPRQGFAWREPEICIHHVT